MADAPWLMRSFVGGAREAFAAVAAAGALRAVKAGSPAWHCQPDIIKNSKAGRRNDALQASHIAPYLRACTGDIPLSTIAGVSKMLRNFDHTPSFGEAQTDLAGRSAVSSSWPIATMLRTIRVAWREGLAAHRQYERLTSRGTPHDKALRAALGIRIPASEVHAARSRAASQCRSHPLTGTARSDEAIVLCRQGLSDSVDPAARLRTSAHIGNLTYVR